VTARKRPRGATWRAKTGETTGRRNGPSMHYEEGERGDRDVCEDEGEEEKTGGYAEGESGRIKQLLPCYVTSPSVAL
jgi:hypothetical protein